MSVNLVSVELWGSVVVHHIILLRFLPLLQHHIIASLFIWYLLKVYKSHPFCLGHTIIGSHYSSRVVSGSIIVALPTLPRDTWTSDETFGFLTTKYRWPNKSWVSMDIVDTAREFFKKQGNFLLKITKEWISNSFLNEKTLTKHSRN